MVTCNQYTGKEFKEKYYRPLVYIWKRGDEFLYIGKCYYGFYRIIYNRLHTVFKKEYIEDTDTIEIHYYDTHKSCLRAEKELIETYKPLYNFKQGRKVDGEGYKDDILHEILPGHKTKQEKMQDKIMQDFKKFMEGRK